MTGEDMPVKDMMEEGMMAEQQTVEDEEKGRLLGTGSGIFVRRGAAPRCSCFCESRAVRRTDLAGVEEENNRQGTSVL